jgi:hypothetical protein
MKKLMVFVVAAILLTTSAFAQNRRLVAEPNATFGIGAPGLGVGPATTNNDDSCDIGVAPAATLLLPYFEVEVTEPANTARTTLFTITNTSYLPQIAHITLWTDWSFPVIDFNIFLTGYDVQSLNLYDILGGGGRAGFIANDPSGTSSETEPADNSVEVGQIAQPEQDNDNPNFLSGALAACETLPGRIPTELLADAVSLLTTGRSLGNVITCASSSGAEVQVGGNHPGRAIGYATIDVAATCSIALPTEEAYYSTEILFDNVLIGEYYDINPDPSTVGNAAGNYAGGNPMVHIRAVPEGGPAGGAAVAIGTNLPYTFYDRYTPGANRQIDRRQPLPSAFAARWIQGALGFATEYKIWREGITGSGAACGDYADNGGLDIEQIVRFDEAENANVLVGGGPVISPQPVGAEGTLPETSQTPITDDTVFPGLSTAQAGAVGGWTYLNLNNGGSPIYDTARAGFEGPGTGVATGNVRQSQNWVIVSMFAEGRYGVDYDAAWLGNGCSPAPTTITQIGPSGGVLVCPTGTTTQVGGSAACVGTNTTP